MLGRLADGSSARREAVRRVHFPFGTQVGAFFYGGSGTPMTTYVNTVNQIAAFVEGRGDMGRTPC